ncbi:unnamed protein product [Phyllotreta striolata]|uniref:LITAF domain-containing protein n=1 Tax=Phyllotreta striolata TaxID=444603 RepID=A0A9N9TG76_PHYSR|nr:unnamed protein product [Phyllotreta striolata]
MDSGSDNPLSEDAVSTGENSEKSNEGQGISAPAIEPETRLQDEQCCSQDERKEKKKTVKQILDEVLNCTVINVPPEAESSENVAEKANKVLTVKEILGEILQYNVCNRFDATTRFSNPFNIPPYAASTSADPVARSDLDVTLAREAPIYRPFQIYSSSTLHDPSVKTESILPTTVDRLLPSYSSVLRQGPPPKVKSVDSFVPKRPPPSYAEVEGIWDDVPSAVSSDSVLFGPDPLYLICPVCRIIVMTQIERERSAITHWIALILCLFLCWPCCLLPYYMKSCSYTYHSCPNCGHYFGMYNPF